MSEIFEIFGKRGRGKTLLQSCEAGRCLRDTELYINCVEAIKSINFEGHNYSFPNRPPVFTNYKVTIPCGYKKYVSSYYIDGFRFGFENDDVDTLPVPPWTHAFFAEGQRYYNSKGNLKLPGWVSRAYEESRHFDLTIWMDVQRPVLIEANIRELADKYIEVIDFERVRDKYGFVRATNFLVREFDAWSDVERYLNGTGNKYIERVISYPFDGFSIYTTKSYFRSFLPTKSKDFCYREHIDAYSAEVDLNEYNWMYPQTAPEGFYPDKDNKGGKKVNERHKNLK